MGTNYKKNEIVGTSDTSFGEVTQNAVTKASESLRHVDWFAVAEQSMILSRLLKDQRGRLNGTNL